MKKQKSLRQLAKELGVSHSYLSQVQNGKRPASEKVNEALEMVSMVSKSEASSGLKIRRRNPCGFESHPRHWAQSGNNIFCRWGNAYSFLAVTERTAVPMASAVRPYFSMSSRSLPDWA